MCTVSTGNEQGRRAFISRICTFADCGRGATGPNDLCPGHNAQFRNGQELRPLSPRRSKPPKQCTGPECVRPAVTKGLCAAHYGQRQRKHELLPIGARRPGQQRLYEGVQCTFDGCDRPAKSVGLCGAHAQQMRRTGTLAPVGEGRPKHKEVCSEETCTERANRGGERWCELHYRQYLAGGGTRPRVRRLTKDGRKITADGYVYVKAAGHPEGKHSGWGLEHRVVMSDYLGRPLWPEENVHHMNGDRTDNRIENLELWSRRQPPGQRVADKLAWAREIIERYGSDPRFA